MHVVPYFLERMFEEGVTVLNVLSISAIITTVSLFFCGIPICIKIWKQQGVGDISGMPFVTGVLGGVFWLRYGLLKFDLTMVVVNVVGVSLMSSYLTFYYIYSPTKKWITVQIMVICVLMSSMLVTVEFYGRSVIHPLGFVCMTFNILNFGSPLAGLGTVVRQKCTSSLPLPLCLATFLVSCQWCLYGTLVSDVYIITPNGIGMILAVTQLTLFVIYPSTQGGTSLLKMLCGCCFGVSNEDAENRHQSGRKSTRFFCRRRPKAAATDKPHKSSIFGRRSVVSVDLSNSLLLSKATLGYVRKTQLALVSGFSAIPLPSVAFSLFCLPEKISPRPCSSSVPTSGQMACENGAFSRSGSLGSLRSLDESEFASSLRGILPNPSQNSHHHHHVVPVPQPTPPSTPVEPFTRLRDVDEHEKRWSQHQQLSRTSSAPELNNSLSQP
ncbi:hypothetical protein L596_006045 [Steinernema carpocapsae]|uniref:Sugar transporter SWEET1 n=1 Tax=Steinernema carpocapsae TaxID=34508 RepID=A0A4U8V0X3_STECR|nr:hypothetical protein L596_006045 [Steinernema carpocapsae]